MKASILEKANNIWPRVGGIASIIILAILISAIIHNPDLNILTWLFWLHLPIAMLHEFEEYVYPGGFKEFYNKKVFHEEQIPALSEKIIFILNIGIWIMITIGAIVSIKAVWFPVMIIIFNSCNALTHLGPFAVKARGYNPGMITSVFLILPYTAIVLYLIITSNLLTGVNLALTIISGFLLISLLLITVVIRVKKNEQLCQTGN